MQTAVGMCSSRELRRFAVLNACSLTFHILFGVSIGYLACVSCGFLLETISPMPLSSDMGHI